MTGYAIFEIVSLIVLTLILAFDLLLVIKRPHVPSMRESTLWVVFYVTLALIFGGVLLLMGDVERATDFITGWALEYSMSIDNLFVFIILLARFAVPQEMQQRVLMIGILIAIVLRGIFILIGVQLVESLSWLFYIFGAYLIYVAWKQAFGSDDHEGEEDTAFVRWLKRRFKMTDTWHGGKFRVRQQGVTYLTPMLMVIIALGTTDLLFAIDSIPAIFSVTTDPFLVLACNIFALMGLRQLYFLLGGLLDRLVYLHYGIAAILGFIGVKLVFEAMSTNEVSWINGGEPFEWVPHIESWHSLIVIFACMVISVVASLIKLRIDAKRTGDDSLHLGPVGAERGADGHFHIVDANGASFARPLRIEPRTEGLVVIDAEGKEAPAVEFDRPTLREAAREDLTDAQYDELGQYVPRETELREQRAREREAAPDTGDAER